MERQARAGAVHAGRQDVHAGQRRTPPLLPGHAGKKLRRVLGTLDLQRLLPLQHCLGRGPAYNQELPGLCRAQCGAELLIQHPGGVRHRAQGSQVGLPLWSALCNQSNQQTACRQQRPGPAAPRPLHPRQEPQVARRDGSKIGRHHQAGQHPPGRGGRRSQGCRGKHTELLEARQAGQHHAAQPQHGCRDGQHERWPDARQSGLRRLPRPAMADQQDRIVHGDARHCGTQAQGCPVDHAKHRRRHQHRGSQTQQQRHADRRQHQPRPEPPRQQPGHQQGGGDRHQLHIMLDRGCRLRREHGRAAEEQRRIRTRRGRGEGVAQRRDSRRLRRAIERAGPRGCDQERTVARPVEPCTFQNPDRCRPAPAPEQPGERARRVRQPVLQRDRPGR